MNRHVRKIAVISVFAILAVTQAAARPRILTVRSVIKKMESALSGLQDFQASYRLSNGKYTSSGRIYYMKPFFLRVNSMTDGCQLVTNGKMLWIMIPRYGIVAEQELIKTDSKYKMLLSTTGKSLRHMRRDYSFRFTAEGKTNPNFYIFDLKPRVTKIGFKKIRMWVDKKTYLITRVASETVNGRKVNIAFTGIKKNVTPSLTKGLFYFGMPDKNIQTIKNTILPTEYMKKRR